MIHRLQQLGKYFYHGVDFTKDLMGNYWSFLEGHIPCLGGTIALVLMIITIVLVISLLMAVSKKFANSVDDEYFVRIQDMDLTAMPRKVFLYVLYAYLLKSDEFATRLVTNFLKFRLFAAFFFWYNI